MGDGHYLISALVESFFQLLKRERIRRRIYVDREEARQDVFDYIEMIYNPTRRHGYNNNLSPVEFEKQYFSRVVKCLGQTGRFMHLAHRMIDLSGLIVKNEQNPDRNRNHRPKSGRKTSWVLLMAISPK